MSTITNDATGNTPGELSEADRLAWLRIERALRGMRWWMLFLVLVATLIGLFLGVGFALAVASEPLSDAGRELLFIACLSSGSATGFALLLVALALARAYLTVRRLGNRVDISIVQRVFSRQRSAWIAMGFCSIVSMCCAAIWFVTICLIRFVWTS